MFMAAASNSVGCPLWNQEPEFGTFVVLQAAFVCDLVLIYIIKKREFYREKKFEKVRSVRFNLGDTGPSLMAWGCGSRIQGCAW